MKSNDFAGHSHNSHVLALQVKVEFILSQINKNGKRLFVRI